MKEDLQEYILRTQPKVESDQLVNDSEKKGSTLTHRSKFDSSSPTKRFTLNVT